MGYRLSKIYTRTGDQGDTDLGDGQRVPKYHPRLNLLGDIDELNSSIGLIIAHADFLKVHLQKIQNELFNVGGELCPPFISLLSKDAVETLEKQIDAWNTELPPLLEFILPGGNRGSAHAHLARCICRRAERSAALLLTTEKFNLEILRYLNRLSDYLFVAGRVLATTEDKHETLWDHQRPKK